MELPKGLALMNVKDLLTMIEVSQFNLITKRTLIYVVERTEQVN
jgi:hypothetical protein